MYNVDFNIKQMVRQLEVQNKRDYTIQDIAKLSGINRFTVSNLLNNYNAGIERKTLARLLWFFHDQGMQISLADLFTVNIPTVQDLKAFLDRQAPPAGDVTDSPH